MANETETGHEYIPFYIIWCAQFIAIGIPNLIITFSILRYEALRVRKEYLIICALSLADFGYLLACWFGGVYRLKLIATGQFYTKRTPSHCIQQPQCIGWYTFDPLFPTMLVVISLDRLLAVTFPLKYFKLNSSYAYRMLGVVYGFCFVMGALSPVMIDYTDQQLVDAPCYVVQVLKAGYTSPLKKIYILYFSYSVPVMAMTSVLIYFGVGCMYWKRKQKVSGTTTTGDRQRQQRLTKTLAMSTFCSFSFVVVPIFLANTGNLIGELPRMVSQFLWLLPQMNPLMNLILYYKRQHEARTQKSYQIHADQQANATKSGHMESYA